MIVAGEHSDSHPAPVVGALVDRFSDATSRIVPNTSHFLPMEVPALVAELIATALE